MAITSISSASAASNIISITFNDDDSQSLLGALQNSAAALSPSESRLPAVWHLQGNKLQSHFSSLDGAVDADCTGDPSQFPGVALNPKCSMSVNSDNSQAGATQISSTSTGGTLVLIQDDSTANSLAHALETDDLGGAFASTSIPKVTISCAGRPFSSDKRSPCKISINP